MGDEHPNALAYRQTAVAFRAGDLVQVATMIDEDVVWHVPGTHPYAGEIRGREAALEWLGRLPSLGFWLMEREVFGNDRFVCALSVMGARREGVDVETTVTSVFRFEAGRQLERWLYPDDPDAWHEIFSGP